MSNSFVGELPLVVSALSRRYGVKVVIGGTQAASDGESIFIPALPLDSPRDLVALARGYLDHEAAHVRETDFDLAKSSKLTPFGKHVWNIIEDWRVERIMGGHYPGCRENFSWLIKRFFDHDLPHGEPEDELLNWMLLTLRSWSVPELEARADALESRLGILMPSVVSEIKGVFDDLKDNCLGTRASLNFARKIVRVLGSFSSQSKNGQKTGKDKDQGDPESGTQDSDDSQPGAGDSGPSQNPSGTGQETASGTDRSFCGGRPNISCPPSQADTAAVNGRADVPSVLRSLLNKTVGELPETFDSKMASCLNAARQQSSADTLSVAQPCPLPPSPLSH